MRRVPLRERESRTSEEGRFAPRQLRHDGLVAINPGAKLRAGKGPPPEPVGRGLRGLSVQPCVSTRSGAKVTHQLAELNERLGMSSLNTALPRYDEEAIVNGKKSLLSLGEGKSTFVSRLVEKRHRTVGKQRGLPPILAFDLAFDSALAKEYQVPYAQPPRELADHYVAGVFQDLDLRDQKGRRRQFDTVVSSWSLAFVVNRARVSEGRNILERVVDHLRPGGALFLPGDWGFSQRGVVPLLEDMRKAGLIRAYDPRGRVVQR
jgi:hypothetical protein